MTVCIHQNLFPHTERKSLLIIKDKIKFSLHHWQDFPSRNMATLRNKRKLVAVSRETPEGSRSSRGQTVPDPELTQDYISQVSEEIEGRVTKKLSKEFSKTEPCILGALPKLDEFLLNPQVRTCSVAVQGTSRNANSENREIHGDRSSDDPYPEVGYFPHHSGQLNSPETETISHMVTEIYPHIRIVITLRTHFWRVKSQKNAWFVTFLCSSLFGRIRLQHLSSYLESSVHLVETGSLNPNFFSLWLSVLY